MLRSCLLIALLLVQNVPVSAAQGNPAPASPASQSASLLSRPLGATSVKGTAVDSADKPLVARAVRLRDTRTGRILKTIQTDSTGGFSFEAFDPGNYVVELLNPDGTVQATSQLLTLTSGDSVTAIIKLPLKVRSLAGVIGHNLPAAALVAGSAAAAGVLAIQVKDCVSPPCERQ